MPVVADTTQPGVFWPAGSDDPAEHVTAVLSSATLWQLDCAPDRPDSPIDRLARLHTELAERQQPATVPALWHGTLPGGRPVTLRGVEWHTTTHATIHCVTAGHHLDDPHITTIAWRVPGAHLETLHVSIPTGTLDLHDDLLTCAFDTPQSWDAARLLALQITRLWYVATGMTVQPYQIRISTDHAATFDEILDLPHQRDTARRTAARSGDLFHCHLLTYAHVAAWAQQCPAWGPVTALTRAVPTIPLEVQVLVYAAGLEGLHRRILGAAALQTQRDRAPETPKP